MPTYLNIFSPAWSLIFSPKFKYLIIFSPAWSLIFSPKFNLLAKLLLSFRPWLWRGGLYILYICYFPPPAYSYFYTRTRRIRNTVYIHSYTLPYSLCNTVYIHSYTVLCHTAYVILYSVYIHSYTLPYSLCNKYWWYSCTSWTYCKYIWYFLINS